ncbi:MAG: hypothetical protein KF686_03520 [Ramlibacter sp.]|nr:hypothetical protein [Ramlibacter sp.]
MSAALIETIRVNDWIRLPSGAICSVRRLEPGGRKEVTLRYIDDDGAMANTSFAVSTEFIDGYCTKVGRHE